MTGTVAFPGLGLELELPSRASQASSPASS